MKIKVSRKAELLGHKSAIYALATAGKNHFYSTSGDGLVVKWNLQELDRPGVAIADIEEQVFCLLAMPESDILVCGAFSGSIYFVNETQASPPRRMAFHDKGIFAVLQVGDVVVAAGGDGKLSLWNPSSAQLISYFALSHESLRSLEYDAQKDELIVGASDGRIYFIDWSTKKLRTQIDRAHLPSVFTTLHLPNAGRLYSGGRDAKIKVWDLETHAPLENLDAHWYTVNQIIAVLDDSIVASASRDKSVRLWDTHTMALLETLDKARHGGHINSANSILWLADRSLLISAGDDQRILVWKLIFDPSSDLDST